MAAQGDIGSCRSADASTINKRFFATNDVHGRVNRGTESMPASAPYMDVDAEIGPIAPSLVRQAVSAAEPQWWPSDDDIDAIVAAFPKVVARWRVAGEPLVLSPGQQYVLSATVSVQPVYQDDTYGWRRLQR